MYMSKLWKQLKCQTKFFLDELTFTRITVHFMMIIMQKVYDINEINLNIEFKQHVRKS